MAPSSSGPSPALESRRRARAPLASLGLASAVLLASAAASAQARPPEPPRDGDEEQGLVVTGTRSPRRLADTPVATEVITRADLEASGAEHLAGVLEEQNGLDVVRSFNGASLRTQGLDPQYVLVLVDGERVNGRVDGAIDLMRFPLDDIERVEIVRGPSSALYGADALGGVVNILTREVRRPSEGELRLAAGSLGSFNASGRAAFRLGDWSNALSAGYHHRDAFDLDPSTPATSGSAFDQFVASDRAEWRPDATTRVRARAEYSFRDMAGVDSSATGAVYDRRNRTETVDATVSAEGQASPTTRLRASGHVAYYRDQYLLDQRNATALDQYQQTRELLLSVNAQLEQRLGSHTVTVGGDGLSEHLASERLATGEGQRARLALYAQDQWVLLARPRLALVPGARLDLDSQFGVYPTPKLAVRFDPHRTLTLRASYGWGFRPPSFQELLLHFENPSVGYVVEGNPALRPETSRSANVGAEWQPVRAFGAAVNLFRNDLENLIVANRVADPSRSETTVYAYENVASATTMGVEAAVHLRPARGLLLDLGYVLTWSRDWVAARPLEGRAMHRATFGAQYRHGQWGLEVSVRGTIVGPRPFYEDRNGDGVDETVQAPPYVTLDARVAKSFGPNATMFVSADNLLGVGDAQYLPIPPRTFTAGATARF